MILAVLWLCLVLIVGALAAAIELLRDVREADSRTTKAPCTCDTDRTNCPIYRIYK